MLQIFKMKTESLEEPISFDYSQCRCCMAVGTHEHTFGSTELKLLAENLNLVLLVNHLLPSALCHACDTTISEVVRFRKIVLASEEQLKKLISENKISDNEESEPVTSKPELFTEVPITAGQSENDPLQIDILKLELDSDNSSRDIDEDCNDSGSDSSCEQGPEAPDCLICKGPLNLFAVKIGSKDIKNIVSISKVLEDGLFDDKITDLTLHVECLNGYVNKRTVVVKKENEPTTEEDSKHFKKRFNDDESKTNLPLTKRQTVNVNNTETDPKRFKRFNDDEYKTNLPLTKRQTVNVNNTETDPKRFKRFNDDEYKTNLPLTKRQTVNVNNTEKDPKRIKRLNDDECETNLPLTKCQTVNVNNTEKDPKRFKRLNDDECETNRPLTKCQTVNVNNTEKDPKRFKRFNDDECETNLPLTKCHTVNVNNKVGEDIELLTLQRRFDFEKLCFLCGKDASESFLRIEKKKALRKRVVVHKVTKAKTKETVLELCLKYDDEWGQQVRETVQDADLVASKAVYHRPCLNKFCTQRRRIGTLGRPKWPEVAEQMTQIYQYIETNLKDCRFSVQEIKDALAIEYPSVKTIKRKLEDRYGDELVVIDFERSAPIYCFDFVCG